VRRGDFGVGEQFVPLTVTPEGLHAHQGFVSRRGPELAGALETTLVLAAGGLYGSGGQRLIGFEDLGRGGVALLESLGVSAGSETQPRVGESNPAILR
jgi:hypothetical protein